jgi:hypothetical protein
VIKVSKQAVAAVAVERPAGYTEELAASSVRQDADYYYLRIADYSTLYAKYRSQPYQPDQEKRFACGAQKIPRLVKWVERFRLPEDRGRGDTLERLLARAGGRTVKHLLQLANLPCGCDDRQKWLNKKYPFAQDRRLT